MFENIPLSKNQLIPGFPILPQANFAEMNQEKFFCIVRTVNKTKCINDHLAHMRFTTQEVFTTPALI